MPGKTLNNNTDAVCGNTTVAQQHYLHGKSLHTDQIMLPPTKTNSFTVSPSTSIGEFQTETNPENHVTIESLRKDQGLPKSKLPFLYKLHILLNDVEETGNDHIVSWLEHGRSFKVYRPKSFIALIAPYYFKQSKFKSFQRQLHLYEFTRTPYGPEAGSYSHPLFVRGKPDMCLSLSPIKIKGKAGRQAAQKARADAAAAAAAAVAATNIGGVSPGKYSSSKQQSQQAVPNSPGKFGITSTTAVLSRKEESEWVAKIRGMLVKGSTLAAQLQNGQDAADQISEQQEEQEVLQPDNTASTSTCCIFGACFNVIPAHDHNVNACHCCTSDHEDNDFEEEGEEEVEEDFDLSFLNF
jgi:hypothetical protein